MIKGIPKNIKYLSIKDHLYEDVILLVSNNELNK
jgi:hypothetical protein